MNILDSLNSAWTSLMNNLSDIYYRSKYGLDISPEDDLWFDQITNVTAPAVEKVVSLDSLNSAWTSLMNNLSDIYYRSKYGLDISPEDDLWFDQITNVTAPAVEKVVSSGNKVKEALLSIPRAVKYILIGAGVLAIIFLISNIRKK
ncbi:MAG TPA: hypothetical protein PK131_01010 [Candidatus Woesebacteria bacterium]|mgnify:CR=1 FL=1|nr:hypothetical protein [Candidatus Woesebacteria bacterium]HRS22690.1 hypothetical protein [Candidatus Woesebacteria bacterium]